MQEENQEINAFWEWGMGNGEESLFTNMGCSQSNFLIKCRPVKPGCLENTFAKRKNALKSS